MRSPFLVNVFNPRVAPRPRQAQADDRAGLLTIFLPTAMSRFRLDDDDDLDEDEDFDEDGEESEDGDDDEDDDEPEDDVETWQVSPELEFR
jgi:hypothetical protein